MQIHTHCTLVKYDLVAGSRVKKIILSAGKREICPFFIVSSSSPRNWTVQPTTGRDDVYLLFFRVPDGKSDEKRHLKLMTNANLSFFKKVNNNFHAMYNSEFRLVNSPQKIICILRYIIPIT